MVWHTATPALWLLTRSLQGPLLGVSREPQAKLRGVAEAASLPVLEARNLCLQAWTPHRQPHFLPRWRPALCHPSLCAQPPPASTLAPGPLHLGLTL